MDCSTLKKMRPMPDSKSQLFWLLFRTCALFWLLITISTDQYLSDPSYRQLKLFLLLHILFENGGKLASFLRSVIQFILYIVGSNTMQNPLKKEAKLVITSFSFIYFQIRIYIFQKKLE